MKQDLCSECSGYFRIFLKLGVALRGMIPYNRFIGSDVFSRTSGRDCGIKTTIQRKQSMENYKAGTDGDALSVSLVFVPFVVWKFRFFYGLPFLESGLFVCRKLWKGAVLWERWRRYRRIKKRSRGNGKAGTDRADKAGCCVYRTK